jgi:hypothetical protein
MGRLGSHSISLIIINAHGGIEVPLGRGSALIIPRGGLHLYGLLSSRGGVEGMPLLMNFRSVHYYSSFGRGEMFSGNDSSLRGGSKVLRGCLVGVCIYSVAANDLRALGVDSGRAWVVDWIRSDSGRD